MIIGGEIDIVVVAAECMALIEVEAERELSSLLTDSDVISESRGEGQGGAPYEVETDTERDVRVVERDVIPLLNELRFSIV